MIASETMPGEALKTEKMPGHWLLARLGKRVLRPGGRQLTHRMIEALNIGPKDVVIEFAPGLGETARLTLKRNPSSCTRLPSPMLQKSRANGYRVAKNVAYCSNFACWRQICFVYVKQRKMPPTSRPGTCWYVSI